MNENFTYGELRDLADMFASEGSKKLALEAVSAALEEAGFDPAELTYQELFYLARCDAPGDSTLLPKDPKLIPRVVRDLRGHQGSLFFPKNHPMRQSNPELFKEERS